MKNEILGEEFTSMECLIDITVPEGVYRKVVINYLTANQDE